jgi:hypothetical protein
MTLPRHPINVAVLGDYQGGAMGMVDWSKVRFGSRVKRIESSFARVKIH